MTTLRKKTTGPDNSSDGIGDLCTAQLLLHIAPNFVPKSSADHNKFATQLMSAVKVFQDNDLIDMARIACAFAIKHFEDSKSRTDEETRLYLTCVQKYVSKFNAVISTEGMTIAVNYVKKILVALYTLKNITEIDLQLNCYAWHNLGELYRNLNQTALAKSAYINAISQFQQFGQLATEISPRAVNTIEGLSVCFAEDSLEYAFYQLAADCFQPDELVHEMLIAFLELFIHHSSVNDDLCKMAIIISDTLVNFYHREILSDSNIQPSMLIEYDSEDDLSNIDLELPEFVYSDPEDDIEPKKALLNADLNQFFASEKNRMKLEGMLILLELKVRPTFLQTSSSFFATAASAASPETFSPEDLQLDDSNQPRL